MNEFWILILVAFFATNSIDKVEFVELEEIDEIFGEGWWDNDKAEEWHKLTLERNFLHQNDRQDTQIGQIEPNSTDQNPRLTEYDHSGQIEPNSTDQNPPLTESDHSGQIEPNSTDQNPPLTESDHSEQIEPNSTDQNPPLTESDHSNNAKNGEEQSQILEEITSNENIAEDEQKCKIVDKFHAIKDEFKQKGKFSAKEWTQIENKIAKHLKGSRKKIYKWKKEFGISSKKTKNERQNLVEKFDQKKAELTRAGFKNSYRHEIDKAVGKELGLSFETIYKWKRELSQPRTNYSGNKKVEVVKKLMQIKSEHSGENKKSCQEINKEIAERFGVNVRTIRQWKKEFGLNRKKTKNERKILVEKFDQMKAELKRAGIKNSYPNQINETVAKELGLNFTTIYRWKSELGQTTPNKYSDSEQKELMKHYYEIKDKPSKSSDADIAKMLKIGSATLRKWKKQFKREQSSKFCR